MLSSSLSHHVRLLSLSRKVTPPMAFCTAHLCIARILRFVRIALVSIEAGIQAGVLHGIDPHFGDDHYDSTSPDFPPIIIHRVFGRSSAVIYF